jgi:dienelactone hydrolase
MASTAHRSAARSAFAPPRWRLPVLPLLLVVTAMAERPAELIPLPHPAGLARLVQPEGTDDAPLVILVPDALGEDGRSELYVDTLLARGIATLVLGLSEDEATSPDPVEPATHPDAIRPVVIWPRAAGFSRVGLLGFGLGGRAVLVGAGGLLVAALYPGCAELSLLAGGPALVLQGDEERPRCARLDLPPGVALHLNANAGHGWDAPGALWPSPGPALPNPAGGARLRARVDLDVTLYAAETVGGWFGAVLVAGAGRASR